MKHFLCAALAIVSAASAAGEMAARAAEIDRVAPASGATVSLLSQSQKLWREATLDERIRKYVIDLGFTEADIEKLRTILFEE